MKKCNECNEEMIENCKIDAQHPFELGEDGRSDLYLNVPTGDKSSFIGIPYEMMDIYDVKARFCPKCGKVELYINPSEKRRV